MIATLQMLAETTTTTGGSTLVIVLALVGLLVTAGLSLAVAYLVIRGYRWNRDRARLWLAIGLILLTTAPIMLQLVLTNLTEVSAVGRSAAANASKLLGLGAMLYAIYGVTRPRKTSETNGPRNESSGAEKAVLPFVPLAATTNTDAGNLTFVFAGITGVAGLFVASLAYRGYRRNGSRPMLYLALGIVLLTAVPAVVNFLLTVVTGATDAEILLSIIVANLGGVVSILYALTRA
ncbi:hypothetical protein [Haladaptatus sp. AB643]|uniref:DUF7521 family protein n=1 Tax=Haladaptatus sp. AB643 TaxID=2934174 RepID=UPI00209C172B|nr:hypothetical protein [Haladaptatus sp. AB643]MCO8243076.1 hypothetical protein [Haladaptatus sp. AB643]